ncbi:hypothetical protein Tco_0830386 [Tanacetum coccineum]
MREWSRFVTAAKQAKDLHAVNFDQLYAFLKHNEHDAKEVQEMRQRYPDQLAFLANQYNPPPSYNIVQQQPALSTQLDSGLVVPPFLPTDDPLASLNKAMLFLSTAMNAKFPPTNNQLRTSPNPRTQATVQDGRVTVQNIQGRQSQGYGVNSGKSSTTRTRVTNTVSDVNANQSRVIMCYNCKGEGYIAKRCTAKKRVKDVKWFKEKMLLAQAQNAKVIHHEDQQDFLADRLEEMDDCDDLQLHTTSNFKADHVDAYDSNCDDEANA